MMQARIIRPPALGAKLISVDTSGTEIIKGVEMVRDGELIVVLHKSPDIADLAATKVKAEYEVGKNDVDDQSIFDYLQEKGTVNNEIDAGGNLANGENKSKKLFNLEYRDPYIAHAPIENHKLI